MYVCVCVNTTSLQLSENMTIGINEVLVGPPPLLRTQTIVAGWAYIDTKWVRAVHFAVYFIVTGNAEFVSKIVGGFERRGCTKSALIYIGLFIDISFLGLSLCVRCRRTSAVWAGVFTALKHYKLKKVETVHRLLSRCICREVLR